VLRPGGFFFARLASSIGIEGRVSPVSPGRWRLPDGTERFLVDEAALLAWTARLGAELAEPLKTTNVQNLRAMTTWCLLKPG
jgi:tellurite methyltransferase